MKAIQVSQTGGPEVLKLVDLPMPEPGPGQVLVKIAAAGVNFIETYQRQGRYKMKLPYTPSAEGAGTVEKLGPGVPSSGAGGFSVGEAVASATVQGSYAEYALVAADRLIKIPAGVDTRQAAAALLQGMTAHYLCHDLFPLKRGQTALIHAAAGGVGLLLTQMARQIGARVIGTVSTEAKAELARAAGADEVILYTEADFEVETRRLTGNAGVDVVFDSVGKDTFDKSLNCLRKRGMMALFGGASGAVPPMDPMVLNAKGSLFLTRPTLHDYTVTREELEYRAGAVLGWVADGKLKLRIEHQYPLADAAQAHIDIESRKTTGKVLLIP